MTLIGRCFLEQPLDCVHCSDSVARSAGFAGARERRSSPKKSFGFWFWCTRPAFHDHHDATGGEAMVNLLSVQWRLGMSLSLVGLRWILMSVMVGNNCVK